MMFSLGRFYAARALTSLYIFLLVTTATAQQAEIYRQMNLFWTIFERVSSHYVDKVNDAKLLDGATAGLLNSSGINSTSIDVKKTREDIFASFQGQTAAQQNLLVFGTIFDKIRSQNPKYDLGKLTRAAVNGMLSTLECANNYIPGGSQPQAPQANGRVGVALEVCSGKIKVTRVIHASPAERARINTGDIITAIDGVSLNSLNLAEVLATLRGPINSSVKVEFVNPETDKQSSVVVRRAIVSDVAERLQFSIEGDVAYIRIPDLAEGTAQSLNAATESIQSQISNEKLKGYVIDLRGNQGGTVDQTIAIADAFLDRGEIMTTRGRDPEELQRFRARPGDVTKGKPIAILINGETSSGAEMVAAALQDHHRAILIGTRSGGRGIIHTVIPLGSGNGTLRLTTARHYSPAGRSFDGIGIKPDIVVETEADVNTNVVPEKKSDDTQLQYAIGFLDQSRK
jgi:carboxyl-terminal processing protease